MGTNKRYDMSKRREVMENDARAAAALDVPTPTADSLTPAELDFPRDPPRKPRQPIPVDVWIRVKGLPVRTTGDCIEFTSHAVLVRWTPNGHDFEQAWVWASAVSRH